MNIPAYCREIETYLCRKNDGHLIRVTGPSFERVSSWAARGVPLRIAFEGIDRYFDRYYRQGPRRRPVKIDFCEADVLDAFDEWRRATGLRAVAQQVDGDGAPPASTSAAPPEPGVSKSPRSLPEHLTRVLLRLSSARGSGAFDPRLDGLIDRIAAELELAREKAGGVRGDARKALTARLEQIDRELVDMIRASLDEHVLAELHHEADAELAPFRLGITAPAYQKAHEAAFARLVRGRYHLPTIAFV